MLSDEFRSRPERWLGAIHSILFEPPTAMKWGPWEADRAAGWRVIGGSFFAVSRPEPVFESAIPPDQSGVNSRFELAFSPRREPPPFPNRGSPI